jgi:uncharacterized repeat protein (TIGR01451 family)
MGRRLFFLLGFSACTLLACQPLRAQAPNAREKTAEDASAASLPPVTAAESALPRITEEPLPETAKKAAKKKGGQLVPAPIDPEVIRIQAAGDANAPAPAPAAAASTPPATVAAGLPPAPLDGSTEGQGSPLSTDRLPLGKQELMVSVEVQSPANLNYEQPATVKIIVKNSGSTDALGVVVRDELPPGLDCLSSQPEAQRVGDSLLSWRISTLPAGSDRIILLKVKPTKVGAFDHAATVTFQAGSKATSRVLRPRLKVEVVQNPTDGKVLKNKTAEFRIAITNTGDGPARDVVVHAKLSAGLRHDSSERNEDNSFELPIQQINPGQREELDPLTVDAIVGGPQWCRVNATSTDVVFAKEEAEVTRTIEVVEPKLRLALAGPDKRYTDTVAPYTLTLDNTLGTAPARNVRVLATLGTSGRLVAIPPGAKYDSASRRLQWTIPQIDPAAKPRTLGFEVRMGGISAYEVNVEARGDNGIYLKDRKITDVQGMPDVDLVVREKRRVVDVGGTTTFQIRLRNYGTKEATKILISGKVSDNLVISQTAGGPEQEAQRSPDGHGVVFPIIERLGPGKEMIMGIEVKVTAPQPKFGTCRVSLTHDDLNEPLEDMAGVKVTETRRAAVTGP